VVRIRVESLK